MSYETRAELAEELSEEAQKLYQRLDDVLSDLLTAYEAAATGLRILADDPDLFAEEVAELEDGLRGDRREILRAKGGAQRKLRAIAELIEALPLPE